MTAFGVRVLLNASYEYLKAKYGILRSNMKIHLRKICHPLQCRNMREFQKRIKTGEVSRSKLREVLELSVKNNII